ncbi:transmembrane protein, putative (macronuclear) [Tetrahymena thermophila SB210]|uniref:Transmembrane protein, putative n=1 Tax=Tetrahymena thermophila (strain SB210) TaxID=312017 RepID=Q22T90_TETTS|nr:transmembrane protein, putative [Tetrahymena thermophila SB210]EAR88548.2 transmembrane protein, putative [Tetrahymena thermophila SB210]|eukprot:XP_001008793.2 transmembrane protein, putative [Tetrahymena thermophila SB210]
MKQMQKKIILCHFLLVLTSALDCSNINGSWNGFITFEVLNPVEQICNFYSKFTFPTDINVQGSNILISGTVKDKQTQVDELLPCINQYMQGVLKTFFGTCQNNILNLNSYGSPYSGIILGNQIIITGAMAQTGVGLTIILKK